MLHAVIMAGGSGTRFWPESRGRCPKQLLAITGRKTMIRTTLERLGKLVPADRTYIATTAALSKSIAEELPELPAHAILAEPCRRDTAPCIGLAATTILRDDPDAIMALMPSDHRIATDANFQNAISYAAALVEEDPKRLITFGIRPTYPAESFGYIERDAPLPSEVTDSAVPTFSVRRFREKPNAELAQEYLDSGNFYWNSGIFVWRAQTILDALRRFQPSMIEHLDRIADAIDTADYESVLAEEFAKIEPISIDFGVMEKVDGVVVVESPFDWDDVGSWRALERLREIDEDGNLIDAEKYLGFNTSRTIVRSSDPNHLIVTMGVDELLVINTPDATFVANKNDEESVRQVVAELKKRGWNEYL
jgi:mannose-1-phosphate guanylyltransferase